MLKLFQLWPLGTLLVGSCALLTHSNQCGFFFFFQALPYFMSLEDAPGSSCAFPDPVLELIISPRSLDSFYQRMVLETKLRVLGVLVSMGVLFLLGPLKLTKQSNPCVYVFVSVCLCLGVWTQVHALTLAYTHIYEFFYMQPFVTTLS